MKKPSVRAKGRARVRARNDGEGIFFNSFFMEGKTWWVHPGFFFTGRILSTDLTGADFSGADFTRSYPIPTLYEPESEMQTIPTRSDDILRIRYQVPENCDGGYGDLSQEQA